MRPFSYFVLPFLVVLTLAPGHGQPAARAAEISPRFEITSEQTLVDELISILLRDLEPAQRVTVRASMTWGSRTRWESEMEFVADQQGEVNVGVDPTPNLDNAKQAPLRILQSMKPAGRGTEERKPLDAVRVIFTAEVNGKPVASKLIERVYLLPEVTRIEVREHGLAATFFRPPGKGPFPSIIVLGGSAGGLSEYQAAVLASRGYATLALAYFNYEHLPKDLIEIPLEYFGTAIRWMQEQKGLNKERLAVMGSSRGGELALLLGTIFPQIKAVVAFAPSHVVWRGFSANPKQNGKASWVYRGQAVPFLQSKIDPVDVEEARKADPTSLTPLFFLQLKHAENLAVATIPVERTQGPILLISGEDDQLWPSTYMATQIVKRLMEHKHPYSDEHFAYQGAGHMIGLPFMPAFPRVGPHPVTRNIINLGGTPEADAVASWDSWTHVLQFLQRNLKK